MLGQTVDFFSNSVSDEEKKLYNFDIRLGRPGELRPWKAGNSSTTLTMRGTWVTRSCLSKETGTETSGEKITFLVLKEFL
jgi:hypothetical protein